MLASVCVSEDRCKATWKRELKLPWREAGPPNHYDDKVDSDQQVVNKNNSLWKGGHQFGPLLIAGDVVLPQVLALIVLLHLGWGEECCGSEEGSYLRLIDFCITQR